ncbi:MAG: FimV/HubP family polar landmark protein [Spongiibacteraceae bacterium]
MSPFRLKLLPLLISSTLISAPVGAVGLGDIELHSNLGKPLEAVIPLSHLDDLGLEQLKVALGTEADYSALGVEFTYQHTLIRLEPIVKDGRGYVRLITRDPVNEPYLNFVLNLRWPQGQVVREYTVLLDPPTMGVAAAASPAPAVVAAAPATASNDVVAVPAPVRREQSQAMPEAGDGYTVRSGDSLWKLAARWRPAGVGLQQMMGAIHSANPDAFIGNDPSRLRAAVALQVPTAEQIAAASPLDTTPVTPLSAPAPAVAAEATSEPTPGPEPMPTGITTGVRDEELVAENAALKSQVADLSTNVGALTDNLGSSQERLQELEAKIGSLIDQLERQRVATQALAAAAGVNPPASESLVNNAIAGDLLTPAPAKTPWWVHASYWSAIVALGAWLAFTQLWRRRNPVAIELTRDDRSERAFSEIEARLTVAPQARITPVEKASYWQHGDVGDISELPLDLVADEPAAKPAAKAERPSFADSNVTRTADDVVDATISAGVFSAFGRFDDAEQVLNEALQRQPERVDLKLHLLDVYKHQDKRDAFIALADVIAQEHAEDEHTLKELASVRSNYLG